MKYIYQVKIGEDWDRGFDIKGELFYWDYQKLVNYLRLNLYERQDGKELIDVGDSELWERDYRYEVRVYKRSVEGVPSSNKVFFQNNIWDVILEYSMLLYVGGFFKWVSSETTPISGKRGLSVKNFPGIF